MALLTQLYNLQNQLSGSQIKSLYEAEPDTNAFTDGFQNSLSYLEKFLTSKVEVSSLDSPITAQVGVHYSVDTSSGSAVINLPSGLATQGYIHFSDKAKTFGVNSLTINAFSGETIFGSASLVLDSDDSNLTIYWVDGNWRPFTSGSADYRKSNYLLKRVLHNTQTLSAVAGNHYIIDSVVAGGIVTVTLPVGNNGDVVAFSDRTTTFGTNSVFVNASGTDTISDAVEVQLELNKDRTIVELTFFDGIWSVTAAESFEDFISGGDSNPPTSPLIVSLSGTYEYVSAGTAVETLRLPRNYVINTVIASLTTAPTGSTLIIDINMGGVSILGNKLTIDAGEKTSTTAATPVTITTPYLTSGSEITLDIDQVGATFSGEGLKVVLDGYWI